MGRRTVLLVAAILVAAVGAVLVLVYVHNIKKHLVADEAPQKVLVAKKIIPAGMTGAAATQDGDFELTALASAAIAQGALSDSAGWRTRSPSHRSTQANRSSRRSSARRATRQHSPSPTVPTWRSASRSPALRA
jgi:hypothetical protein